MVIEKAFFSVLRRGFDWRFTTSHQLKEYVKKKTKNKWSKKQKKMVPAMNWAENRPPKNKKQKTKKETIE